MYRLRRFADRWRRIFRGDEKASSLNLLLAQFVPDSELPERLNLLARILRWLLSGTQEQSEARFRYFVQTLDAKPEWKATFSRALDLTLREAKFFGFFTEIGVAVEHGLWGELASRLIARFVGRGDRADMARVFFEGFTDQKLAVTLAGLSPETVFEIREYLAQFLTSQTRSHLVAQSREALYHLATHVAHYGLSSAIQTRVERPNDVSGSPFFQITATIRAPVPGSALETVAQCDRELTRVYEHLERSGVSVDVVNRLETLSELLERLKALLERQAQISVPESARAEHALLVSIVEAQSRGRALMGHLKRHFYLLSRKVVERNGTSGEHYIARSTLEIRRLFVSAIGGGAIVVAMTIAKTLFLHGAPAPLLSAIGVWWIYAFGFLAMQFTGATLATKIPSFTASSLSRHLKNPRLERKDFRAEVELVFGSQLWALCGNLCGAVPVAFLLDYLLRISLPEGRGLMGEDYARHVLDGLRPFHSLAIPLGILTGLQLWLSSLAGGWFENWIVFNRVPESLRENFRLRQVLGDAGAERVSNWLLHHASGLGANVSLGFLFGFCPLVGGLFNWNWNGNHVTISSAQAAFAFSSTRSLLNPKIVWEVLAGLLTIGLMNFFVSFALALYVAGSARGLTFRHVLRLLREYRQKD